MKQEEILFNHNKMICEIIEKCEYMIMNRHYLNDIGIKNCAEEIKAIAKFYLEDPKWRNRV